MEVVSLSEQSMTGHDPPLVNFRKLMFVCGKMPCPSPLSSLRMDNPIAPCFFVFRLVSGVTHLFLISGNGLNPQSIKDCIIGWDKAGVPGT